MQPIVEQQVKQQEQSQLALRSPAIHGIPRELNDQHRKRHRRASITIDCDLLHAYSYSIPCHGILPARTPRAVLVRRRSRTTPEAPPRTGDRRVTYEVSHRPRKNTRHSDMRAIT